MKVYVITQGEYSDYGIRAVSLDKEDAERKCALLNRNVRNGEYCEIEEYNTDDLKVNTDEEVKKKFVMETRCGTEWFYESYLTFNDENKIHSSKGGKIISAVATFPTDTTEEQAKKIMLDRVAKFKAERVGL